MNPLTLMNNDMATLILGSQNLFEHWNDQVAEQMKTGCIEKIQKEWNAYMDQINTDMRIFMRAERQIEEAMEDYERKYR